MINMNRGGGSGVEVGHGIRGYEVECMIMTTTEQRLLFGQWLTAQI